MKDALIRLFLDVKGAIDNVLIATFDYSLPMSRRERDRAIVLGRLYRD